MTKQRKRKVEGGLVEGKLSGSIWKLAAPMMIGGALQDLFSLVDLFFVGKLGHVEVAALAIAGTTMAILSMLVQGIGVGTVALISHFTGEKIIRCRIGLGANACPEHYWVDVDADCFFFLVEPLLMLLEPKAMCCLCGRVSQNQFHFLHRYFLFAGDNTLQGSGGTKTPLYALSLPTFLILFLLCSLWMILFRYGVCRFCVATVITLALVFCTFCSSFFAHSTRIEVEIPQTLPSLMKRIKHRFASLQVFIREISFCF